LEAPSGCYTSCVLLLETSRVLCGPLAYLDPGSGALLVQLLLAGTAGAVLFFKMQGRRVMSFFGLRRKDDEVPPAPRPGDGPG
jgi:hypothetical protein